MRRTSEQVRTRGPVLGPVDAFQLRHLQLTWLDFLLSLELQYSITVSFGFVILAENPAWESFLELQPTVPENVSFYLHASGAHNPIREHVYLLSVLCVSPRRNFILHLRY